MVDKQTIFSYLQSGFSVAEIARLTGAHIDYIKGCELTIAEIEAHETQTPDWGEDSAFYANQR